MGHHSRTLSPGFAVITFILESQMNRIKKQMSSKVKFSFKNSNTKERMVMKNALLCVSWSSRSQFDMNSAVADQGWTQIPLAHTYYIGCLFKVPTCSW